MGKVWSNEDIERARVMWCDGYSASQIARAIGGITRNAVVGIMHRRGFPKSGTAKTIVRQKPARTPKAIAAPVLQAEEVVRLEMFGPVNDFPAIGTCRYTHHDPAGAHWQFCGYPTGDLGKHPQGDPNKPWCAVHLAVVSAQRDYTTPTPGARPAGNPAWRRNTTRNQLDFA